MLAAVAAEERAADTSQQLLTGGIRQFRNEQGGDRRSEVGSGRGSVLAHAVSRRDVADLMTENGGQFGLGIDIRENAAGNIDITARQGEGIDLWAVKHGEVITQARAVALRRKSLANPIDIGLQLGIVVNAVLFPDLRVILSAQPQLLGLGHQYDLGVAGDRIGGATGC